MQLNVKPFNVKIRYKPKYFAVSDTPAKTFSWFFNLYLCR